MGLINPRPCILLVLTMTVGAAIGQQNAKWRIVQHDDKKQIDILYGDHWMTSCCWYDSIRKPILYPIKTFEGITVTRGFPIDPRPGERVDHPHHTGLWFNYESVNGLDFWNNSTAIPLPQRNRYGTIRHQKVIAHEAGSRKASLTVEAAWTEPGGKTLLTEQTQFIFSRVSDQFVIDRITRLVPTDSTVYFKDTKDGLLGIRVARELEMPTKEPLDLIDAHGNITRVDTTEGMVTGHYKSSEGLTGEAVWGTRGRWCTLAGVVNGNPVSVTMIDHPSNPGYPTYWHARGYGLFAANPLGQEVFSKGKESLNFHLNPGQSATFKYRIVVSPMENPPVEQLQHVFLDEY